MLNRIGRCARSKFHVPVALTFDLEMTYDLEIGLLNLVHVTSLGFSPFDVILGINVKQDW